MSTNANDGDFVGPARMVANGTGGKTSNDDKGPDNGKPGDTGGNDDENPTEAKASKTAAAAVAEKKRPPLRRSKPSPPDRPTRALFCLSLTNPVRKMCIAIIEWKYPLCKCIVNFKKIRMFQ